MPGYWAGATQASPRVRVQDSETTTWEKPEELGWRRVIKDEL
jgi:hypothetical protein